MAAYIFCGISDGGYQLLGGIQIFCLGPRGTLFTALRLVAADVNDPQGATFLLAVLHNNEIHG